ncbi:lytic transglycosylase [Salinivibrio sp. ML323]|uniref:lytic murein transglycosylase n=1 Tax=unclassified Salinivibrio TaxID=2636825 RepID=UPI000984FC53|nr:MULTISPECIES: lytic murein transglycosylase [unclassified Salinivibrio]OOE58863.1 lytic transglycosylase [Salinivibrio sp. ML323]OOE67466.1 lytic transglycosylase [Salinivibrio sp. IB282]
MRKGMISASIAAALLVSPVMAKPGFEQYVTTLKAEAREAGISDALLERAFKDVKYHERAVSSDRNQPERRLTLDEYIPRAVPDWKVAQAKQLYREHYDTLKAIGEQYQVQPRFIVALWGVESNFGKLQGSYNVIEALSTLAFDGRREAFFRKETMAALTILEQGHIAPEAMKGSWAGAMGQCQFMPSSFINYAVDGNQDGKKDIWQTEADVFASAANYLKKAGWDDTYTWGRQVQIPEGIDRTLLGTNSEKAHSLSEWQTRGVRRMNGQALPAVDINAWLIQPDDGKGRAYLVYNNYQSLLKWNRSHYFALAVSHLADRIKFG